MHIWTATMRHGVPSVKIIFAFKTASQSDFIQINPEGFYQIISNLKRVPPTIHIKTNSTKATNSTNIQDCGYK